MVGQQVSGGGQSHHRGSHEVGVALREQLITVYNIVSIVGLALNILILFVAFVSRKVQRCHVWYMFIISWIVLSLSYLFLLGQQTGPEPQFGFCLAQAVLVYASPPLTAFITLTLAAHLYFVVNPDNRGRKVTILTFLPPVVFIAVAVRVLVKGLMDRTLVQRDQTGMFCHITNKEPAIVNLTLIGFAVIPIFCIEAATIIHLQLNWVAFLKTRASNRNQPVALGVIIRFALFTIAPISVFIIELVFITMRKNDHAMSISEILFAALPLLAALTFGTQSDIMRAMLFWRRDVVGERKAPETMRETA